MRGEDLVLPYVKEKIKDAPKMDADKHLDVDQERELYQYYGLDYDAGGQAVGRRGQQVADGLQARDVAERRLSTLSTIHTKRRTPTATVTAE